MAKDSVHFDRQSNKFLGIDSEILVQLRETFVGVDIDQELRKMCVWLQSEKGKRRKGNIGFIMHWLNNATPMPPTATENLDLLQSESPLGILVRNYLQELWKDREHIFELNTTKVKR